MGFAEMFGRSGAGAARENVFLHRRVAVLEAQVEQLMRHTGMNPATVRPPDPVSDEVRRLIAENKIILAVKQHREETGLGLAEAKADVDMVRRGR